MRDWGIGLELLDELIDRDAGDPKEAPEGSRRNPSTDVERHGEDNARLVRMGQVDVTSPRGMQLPSKSA